MQGKLRIIILAAIAVICFAVSYVVSPWLGGEVAPPPVPGAQDKQPAADGQDGPVAVPAGGVSHPTIAMKEKELTTMIRELRLKIDTCRTRDQDQAKRKKRIMMAEEGLKKQIQELEKLRLALIPVLQRIAKEKTDLEAARTRITAQENKNIKSAAGTYDAMDAESAGKIFAEWCAGDQDQQDYAVKILYYMQSRSQAKLLAAMDPKTAATLSKRLKTIQKPALKG